MLEQKPGESGRQNFGAFELRIPGRRATIAHRRAGIANDVEAHVGFLHVTFYAEPIVAGIKPPVEVPQIVSGLVVAIIAEFDAESVERAVVQTA